MSQTRLDWWGFVPWSPSAVKVSVAISCLCTHHVGGTCSHKMGNQQPINVLFGSKSAKSLAALWQSDCFQCNSGLNGAHHIWYHHAMEALFTNGFCYVCFTRPSYQISPNILQQAHQNLFAPVSDPRQLGMIKKTSHVHFTRDIRNTVANYVRSVKACCPLHIWSMPLAPATMRCSIMKNPKRDRSHRNHMKQTWSHLQLPNSESNLNQRSMESKEAWNQGC